MNTWIVSPEEAGTRLDLFLKEHLSDLSRGAIQRAIEAQSVLVNEKPAVAHTPVKEADRVTYDPAIAEQAAAPHPNSLRPMPEPAILAETEDWIAINKPAGVLVHPDDVHQELTIADWFAQRFPAASHVGGDPVRPGIVHRLDREVSGVMLLAKTERGYESLTQQFKARSIQKTYIAIVHGEVSQDEGDVKFRIARSAKGNRMAALPENDPSGRAAWTHFRVLERFIGASFVEFDILSGRTHQIRAHAHAMQHPVMGDTLYTLRRPERTLETDTMLLQSVAIRFNDPQTNERIYLSIEPHAGFKTALRTLRGSQHHSLFIITGLSGAGKTTIADALMQKPQLGLQRFVTTTTRAPREGEQNGVQYWFTTREEFERAVENNGFYEHANVYENYYGVSKKEMQRLRDTGKPILLVVDVQGARTIKQLHPEAHVFFIDAPDADLHQRLEERGGTPQDIARRMAASSLERESVDIADMILQNTNGDLEETLRAIEHRITMLK